MAITLVVNPGSSSKKYALYEGTTLKFNAYIEHSTHGYEMCTAVAGIQQTCVVVPKEEYQESVLNFLEHAIKAQVLESITEIKKIAIRIVAPGTYFQSHHIVDDNFMLKLDLCAAIAPLHVPHIQKELKALRRVLPQASIAAVSDSAFHKTMSDPARSYSLPAAESEVMDLYRFGYHGLSVASVSKRLHAVTGSDPKRVIVCHIGSGVSVTALKGGESFDTTMGYAPGSGLIMGTRAGDIDAGALLALMQARHLKPVDAQVYIQTQGGLKGMTSEADLRFLLERRAKGDKVAKQAIASFVYQLKKAIGAYVAVLGGLDTLVFTATAGERSPIIRALVTDSLESLGIILDVDKNEACISRDGVISSITSPVKVAVIKTDEASEILFASQLVIEQGASSS
jgi:acetate kinase